MAWGLPAPCTVAGRQPTVKTHDFGASCRRCRQMHRHQQGNQPLPAPFAIGSNRGGAAVLRSRLLGRGVHRQALYSVRLAAQPCRGWHIGWRLFWARPAGAVQAKVSGQCPSAWGLMGAATIMGVHQTRGVHQCILGQLRAPTARGRQRTHDVHDCWGRAVYLWGTPPHCFPCVPFGLALVHMPAF